MTSLTAWSWAVVEDQLWPALVRIIFWSLVVFRGARRLVLAVVEAAEDDREAHVAVDERDQHLVALLGDEARAVAVARVQLADPAPVGDLGRRRTTGTRTLTRPSLSGSSVTATMASTTP